MNDQKKTKSQLIEELNELRSRLNKLENSQAILPETQIAEAHQHFLAMLDSLDAIVYVTDLENYNILFVNKYTKGITGDYSEKKCWQVLHGNLERPCEFCSNSKLFKSNGEPAPPVFYEVQNSKDKKWYKFKDQAIKWIDGKFVKLGIGVDISDRIRRDESNKSFELHYQSILEEAGIMLSTYDKSGICILMNSNTASLFNGVPQDFVGKHYLDLHPDMEDDFDNITKAVFSGHTISFEDWVTFPAGERYLVSSVLPIKNIDGKIQALQIVSKDFTERNRAIEELKESEYNYRSMFDHAGVFLSKYDYEGNILAINTPAARSLNGSPEELLGKNLYKLFPDFPEYLIQRVRDVIDSGEHKHFDEKVLVPTGERWMVSTIMPMKDMDGNVNSAQIISHDFTAQMLASEKLEIQEERFKFFFSAISDAILVHPLLDEGFGKFVEVNQVAIERYGYSREEWLNLTAKNIINEKIAHKLGSKENRKQLKEMGYRSFETYHIKKSGEEFPVEIRSTIVDQLETPMILTVVRDLTEQRKAEEERALLETQLTQAQKMESIGRLAGGVAHDFNNMLGVILGNAELALYRLGEDHPVSSDLNEIIGASERSANLTRQLLTFARKQTISPEVLDLNKVINGMLKMLQRLIGEDIELSWQPGENLWSVKLDPTQIDQVLANLCVNARDAIDGVGRIIIETRNVTIEEEYCVDNPGFHVGDYVMFSVSDDGCGMDKEIQKNLFEPFFTTKGIDEGTGLGLSTVFGIVKQNHGFINVYSEPSEGSTFTIYLSRHFEKPAMERTSREEEMLEVGTETILLVEDEAAILQISQKILSQIGYKVITASSPSEALNISKDFKGNIDLLVTDVIMPEMNGRELADALIAKNPDLKVLFMSGYTADLIAHHGILDNGVTFVQKPFTAKSFSEKIRQALGK